MDVIGRLRDYFVVLCKATYSGHTDPVRLRLCIPGACSVPTRSQRLCIRRGSRYLASTARSIWLALPHMTLCSLLTTSLLPAAWFWRCAPPKEATSESTHAGSSAAVRGLMACSSSPARPTTSTHWAGSHRQGGSRRATLTGGLEGTLGFSVSIGR